MYGDQRDILGEHLYECAASSSSKIDRNLVRLLRASILENRREYRAAYELFSAVDREPHFLAADGSAGAIRCLLAMGRASDAKEFFANAARISPGVAAALKELLDMKSN